MVRSGGSNSGTRGRLTAVETIQPCTAPILLYSDNPLAIRFLRQRLLARQPGAQFEQFQRTAGCSEGGQFLLVADEGCDEMSHRRFLTVLQEIRGKARILLLGQGRSTQELSQLLLAGVHGFVPYD